MPKIPRERVTFCEDCGKEMLWPKKVCEACIGKRQQARVEAERKAEAEQIQARIDSIEAPSGELLWWLPIALTIAGVAGGLLLAAGLAARDAAAWAVGSALLGFVVFWVVIWTAVRVAMDGALKAHREAQAQALTGPPSQ